MFFFYLNLKFELPLNESQTNTFKNPLSSVGALHTSQTGTSCSIPINLRLSCTEFGERNSSLRKLITSNEVLKAKRRVLASVKMQNRCFKKALNTLSWDSTTVNGDHINEIHVSVATSPPKSYVLCLKTIAGGTTDDYTSHICESIHNNYIVTTYATFHSLEYVYTKTTILKNLKNTLCDRVAVNHCVVQSLQDKLEMCRFHQLVP